MKDEENVDVAITDLEKIIYNLYQDKHVRIKIEDSICGHLYIHDGKVLSMAHVDNSVFENSMLNNLKLLLGVGQHLNEFEQMYRVCKLLYSKEVYVETSDEFLDKPPCKDSDTEMYVELFNTNAGKVLLNYFTKRAKVVMAKKGYIRGYPNKTIFLLFVCVYVLKRFTLVPKNLLAEVLEDSYLSTREIKHLTEKSISEYLFSIKHCVIARKGNK